MSVVEKDLTKITDYQLLLELVPDLEERIAHLRETNPEVLKEIDKRNRVRGFNPFACFGGGFH